MRKVIIMGAGGHGKVIADIIKKSGDNVVGFLDSDMTKPGVIGKIEDCTKFADMEFVIAIGSNEVRKSISQKYKSLKYYTAVHPTAVIGEKAVIGEGTVVMANGVINPYAKIGKHCIVNTAAIVEHDNIIGNYTHLSPGAVLCGTVSVGECVHIGARSVIKNNISVCDNVIVGAGAAVVKNIDKAGVYVGVPTHKLI